MGLEDLVPEDKRGSSSRSRGKRKKKDTVSFGGGRYKKEFTEERWEEIKNTLINEMGLVPNEVVNNYPAEERYEVLHEAALLSKRETTLEELGRRPTRCGICGKPVGGSGVEFSLLDGSGDIHEIEICISHTAGQIQVLLEEISEN